MYIFYTKKQEVEDDEYEEYSQHLDYYGTCIKLSVPLLIRLLEYAREDAQSDEDLHWITERALEHSTKHKVLSMEHYLDLVPQTRLVTVEVGPGQKIEVESINE